MSDGLRTWIDLAGVRPLWDACMPPQRKATIILLTSTVLMLTWAYFASPQFLADRFATAGDDGRAAGAVGAFVGCFVLLGVVPALVITVLFRERLADYGVGWGVPGRTWLATAVLVPIFILVAYTARTDASLLSKFPINPRAGDSVPAFALHAAPYLLFYIGWEFHFRGYLLFGLRDAIGPANAVLV